MGDTKKKSFVDIFYKNAGYFAVVLVSLAYIASSLILISKTGKTVAEIIATGALSMVVGILITGIFRSIGLQKGDSDERLQATEKLHSQKVDEVIPYIDMLDDFCSEENKRVIKNIRTKILAKEGLRYDDCFDENGVSRELIVDTRAKNYKKKLRAYNKAVNLNIKPLVGSNLTAEGVNMEDPFNFGKTKKQYAASHNSSDLIVRGVMAVVFGYFSVAFADSVNFASIIWNTMQIIMYVAGGVMQMHNSCMWVVNDYRHNKIRKIDILEKFKLYAEARKEKEEIPQSPTVTAPHKAYPQVGTFTKETVGECVENG